MPEPAAAPAVPSVLPSYVLGDWHESTDRGREVRDATTGELVTRVSSAGVDVRAVVDHARDVGGTALRALTFHQRGLVLKELGAHLMTQVERYHAISATTGTTVRDAQVDVEGGIGTLFAYSSIARRKMPNSSTFLDGGPERISRNGTFTGQHIATSLRGVGVQINAFNFPVWGMLEKFAPMFVAGLPVIVKPGTASAHLTQAVVADMLAFLPEGSLQLICGSVGGLLDHLGEQDVMAFTGSADTARTLAAHPCVRERGTRFSAEADSLNFSLLGPDVAAEDPEFTLFVKQVVTEMTAKAGQKCTAIRRVLVPESMLDPVAEALVARLATVRSGDPRAEGVRLGPVISLEQKADVLGAVDRLVEAGAKVLTGGREASPEGPGAFVAPTLLRAEDRWAEAVHDVEAFGPVATLVPYADLGEAVALAARGRGSLVGSVVSHDAEVVREVVLGTAPWHGRLLVLDRDDAKESTGHGSPLPTLVHGGPGRAGGGEELGGLRGVLHYMQRTAVQASPAMMQAVTGTWAPGAPRTTEGPHPFSKSLLTLRVGDTVESASRTITAEDVARFAEFTGDTFYAHTDAEAAAANPFFPGIVAHGYLLVSFAAGLFVWPEPGPVLANYGLENLRFVTPVEPGDSIRVFLTAKQITPRETDEYGEVRWDAEILNQDEEIVASYDVLTLVAKE